MAVVVPLPDDATLDMLTERAAILKDLAAAGVPGALDLVGAHHPKGPHPVTLAGARMVVARHHGFPSWPMLRAHLEMVDRYRREPDRVDAAACPDLAGRFLALACLRYGDGDGPHRWRRAAALLAEHPELTSPDCADIHVAAATANAPAVERLLAADAGLARDEGGPFGWEPLLYLAYARHDPAVGEEAVLTTVGALLGAGADPNAGYLWHGLYPPFTALTGVLGSVGGDCPAHPHAWALAELLLVKGADPNDGQALYNRQFGDDDRHLVLLLDHGLGRGDGGPWRRRFGARADAPGDLLRGQLWWAVVHGMSDRTRLLVDAGTDIVSPYLAPDGRPASLRTSHGRSPAQVAALAGYPELAAWLTDRGSPPPADDGVDALIAAALRADRSAVERSGRYLPSAREERPALMAWAATLGRPDILTLLADLGWGVNALGRTDIPMEQAWETALHLAAGNGDVELTRTLLELGADPTIKDGRFDSTPLGWARHFGRRATAELLEPLS